ncbi:hypothetical protein BJ912DRAFT_1057793 [Pholiota molesta]|nr:hypothetical protein BJ912DRAFT_1057793 [Pholiota molesta]
MSQALRGQARWGLVRNEDTDEKLRDVAALLSPPAEERVLGASLSFVYSKAVEEKDTSVPPAGTAPTDTEAPDPALLEAEREEFMTLIQEELEMADVLAEIPPVVAWAPSFGGKYRPTDTIKPVEISQSLYAPLTQLITHLKNARQEEEIHLAVEVSDDKNAAAEPSPPEPPPPRDTAAQIWKNLQIIGRTMSTDDAWTAYVYLIDTLSEYPRVQELIPQIPFSHLHRFCRVLSRHRPKTHRQFLRLLSVLTYIKHCGGELKHWELNALIDLAGRGWRKTQPGVVAKQMEVLNDLLAGRMPGVSEYAPEGQQMLQGPAFKPDVHTLTSLITVAARGGETATLRELAVLMSNCQITPNRVTYVAMLRYYVQKQDLAGLRATLQRMRQLDIDLGLEGLNACIDAYSRFQKLDVVLIIYRLLRHNVIPEEYRGENDVIEAAAKLGEEFIFVEEDMLPDQITIPSGYGTSPDSDLFIDAEPSPVTFNSYASDFEPTIAVYRAIFLGQSFKKDDWTLNNLRKIFSRFLLLPIDTRITQAHLWTILDAFGKTSDWNYDELRQVWVSIDERFGIQLHKPHGNAALTRLKRTLFPEGDQTG